MTEAQKELTGEPGQPLSQGDFALALESLVSPGATHIAVGVSGGADSMALVLLASAWAAAKGITLTALTVDHRLRPQSSAEAQTVAAWLKARGIAHHILTWHEGDGVRHLSRSAQDAAREARFALLSEWCRAQHVQVLLMAHHADDQIETFYMRLARGSGVTGLGGMDAVSTLKNVRIVRPVLGFAKSDLVATCRSWGQDWIEDPSNSNSKYKRTRFRQSRALMEAEGFTRDRVLMTIAHMHRAKAALAHAVGELQTTACIWTEYGTVTVSAMRLFAAPEEVHLRLLSDVLRVMSGHDYGPRFEALQRLQTKLGFPQMPAVTLHGCYVVRSGDSILVTREPSATRDILELTSNTSIVWDGRFEIAWGGAADTSRRLRVRPYKNEDKAWWRAQGDIGALDDLPARVRRSLPVIEDDHGPVALPHAGLWRIDVARLAQMISIRYVGCQRLSSPYSAEFLAD